MKIYFNQYAKINIITTLLLYTFALTNLFSQNIVPNNSLEDTVGCPPDQSVNCMIDYLQFAPPWYGPTCGSADFFHACSSPFRFGVPINSRGVEPAQDGQAYFGYFASGGGFNDFREYMQVKLLQPLVKGKTYYVRGYFSLSDIASISASDGQEFFFSTNPFLDYSTTQVLTKTAHITNFGNIITNTNGWTLVCGTFVADSAYEYLTIGNFRNELTTSHDISMMGPGPAYYFVDNILVSEYIPQSITINGKTIYCPDEDVILTADGSFDTYSWVNLTNPSIILSSTNTLIDSPSNTTTYIIKAINTCFQDTARDTIELTINSVITVNLNDTTACLGNTIILDPGNIAQQYMWSTGEVSQSITVSVDGNYQLNVSNGASCTGFGESNISFINCDSTIGFFIPNAFSPNGDGINDRFRIKSEGINVGTLKIFNRWGRKVFESDDLNSGWDGKSNAGRPLNEGVYVYVIIRPLSNDTEQILKGNVMLLH